MLFIDQVIHLNFSDSAYPVYCMKLLIMIDKSVHCWDEV